MTEFPMDDDGDVLRNLQFKGVDLNKPREIEFYCYAEDVNAAREIANTCDELGFATDIFDDDGTKETSKRFSVYMKKTMVPSYEGLVDLQAELNRILKPFGTSCDGWGTLVDPAETNVSD